jgi:glycosyltransferase involved in cell wall biosynthesis
MVRPLSPFSIFVCHFPDTLRRCYFAAHEYSTLVVSSLYATQWVKRLWGLEPDLLVYPAVEMESAPAEKENVILSAARFEPGGSKKQRELIEAFESLRASRPDTLRDWRLILAGGSMPKNPYLKEIERLVAECGAGVELRVNVPLSELQDLYAKAKIFWHACGLGENNPRLIEHFGMTTVEAMQNRCVPVVIDGGGQREIVEHGRSGYRFNSIHDLCDYTLKLITTPELMERLKEAAYLRGQEFTQKRFEEAVDRLFRALEEEYRRIPVPDPGEILRDAPRADLFYSPVSRRDSARLQQIRR